ncbi:MAG: UDP-N-acetylglucosamine--peptide N-acetylglucosaminyltransferase GtfA subunit [Methanoregula sp. SKADARSKE-2]|nr:MAG: UDP-N-acetylglucosamine--peptide N-acetylglucosaminyltransferase GtfA subunit [Methanoregula sp. SKADARSKE-2]
MKKSIGVITALLITGGSDRLLDSIYSRFVKKGYSVTIYAAYPSKEGSVFISAFRAKGIVIKTPPSFPRSILLLLGLLLATPLLVLYPFYSRFNRERVSQFYEYIFHFIERSLIDPVYQELLYYRILVDQRKEKFSWISGYHYSIYPVLSKLKKNVSIPVYYTEISSPKGRVTSAGPRRQEIDINRFDKIFVPSSIIGKELEVYENLKKEYFVIPFFVDLPKMTYLVPQYPAVTFGIIARLSPEKNLDFLIRSLTQIKNSNPSVRLVLVGSGPQDKELKKLAETLGVITSVKFISTFRDIREIMKEIDIFTLCSDIEGMPLTLIEAMAYGKPILATPAGSIPEMVTEGCNGFMFTKEKPDDLIRFLRELIEDYEHYSRVSQNSRKMFEQNYNPNHLFAKLLDECERA